MTDCGEGAGGSVPASKALVFMVNAINDHFKITVGHFFVDSMTGQGKIKVKCIYLSIPFNFSLSFSIHLSLYPSNQLSKFISIYVYLSMYIYLKFSFVSELASLVTTAIQELNKTGVVVLNTTCDNPSSNWAMLEHLGARLDLKAMKLSLNIKNVLGIPILATPDVCHLMKLVRNCWGTVRVFKDGDGDFIKWSYVEELNNLQQNEGLTLANKLRLSHIQWQKNKMCTRLALQTLSNSVADSIDFCREKLKLSQFDGSEATTKFLRKFDMLFDILNSKSKFGKRLSAPFCKDTAGNFKNVFQETENYILGLSLPNGKKIVHSQRSRGFVGLIVTMKSTVKLYEAYILPGHIDYLLTYKLSQDHLGLIKFEFNFELQ